MKGLLPILGLVLGSLLAGCDQTSEGEAEIDLNAFVSKNYPNCSNAVVCGNLAYVDCNSAADGPAYYFNKKTGARISTCGGAWMVPDTAQAAVSRTLCPPKEWTCK